MKRTNNKPCKHCPFIAKSKSGYDKDGLQALDNGLEPSCHDLVGSNNIFEDTPPVQGFECVGFIFAQQGKKGFCRPRLIN